MIYWKWMNKGLGKIAIISKKTFLLMLLEISGKLLLKLVSKTNTRKALDIIASF